MPTNELFLEALRGALRHLYDPYYLRRSPLIGIFKLQDQPDAIPALQCILREAIEKLEPAVGAAYSSQAQLVYDLLTYRYVQQFGQEEVASQLGMSVRHLRREQNTATYILAAELWKEHRLGERAFEAPIQEPEKTEPEESSEADELAYLRSAAGPENVEIEPLISSALLLAKPLANRYNVQIEQRLANSLPAITTHPGALRQMLLSLLNIAILRGAQSTVSLSAAVNQGKVEVCIASAPGGQGAFPGNPSEKSNQEMALRLAEICGCTLAFHVEGGGVRSVFNIPTRSHYHVLVIDDNPDNYRLMQRLTGGTRYQLLAIHDPSQAVSTVEETQPDLILLDVMMPQIDGWEILGRLHAHPACEHIPIVICTILAQEEMALALGASGFIRKPITRENLLTELDRQAQLWETTPR